MLLTIYMISRKIQFRLLKNLSVAGVISSVIGGNISFAENDQLERDIVEKSGISLNDLNDLSDQKLFELLSDEDYSMRKNATKAIWRRGQPMMRQLTKALESSDPELLYRVKQIIHYIRIGISPDTPQHITKLVESFPDANRNDKEKILNELNAEEYYSLMLFLISEMDDKKLARNLYSNYNRLAYNVAQASIGLGDLSTAIAQLKLAPRNSEIERSLAYLYQQSGLIDEELNKLEGLPKADFDENRKLDLLLAKGDRSRIRKYAERKNLTKVLHSLDLLEGDPTGVIEMLTADVPFIAKAGVQVIQLQYTLDDEEAIKPLLASQMETLKLFEGNKQTNLVNQIVKSFAITGAKDLLEGYLVENYPIHAFSYFLYEEEPEKALNVIGITDDESLNEFINKETDLIFKAYTDLKKGGLGNEILFQGIDASKLLMLVEFYENRNQSNKAKQVIRPLLEKVKNLKGEEWKNLIASLFDYGMYKLAEDFIIEYSEENEAILDEMVLLLFDDTISNGMIWASLHQRDGVSKEKALRDFFLLMGGQKEKIKAYHQLQDDLLEISKNKGGKAFDRMQEALSAVSLSRQDYVSHVKYTKTLLDKEKKAGNEDAIKARKHDYYSALISTTYRKELVKFLENNPEIIGNSSRRYALFSIAHRKLGNMRKAEKSLEQAKLLSVGVPYKLIEIAEEYALAGYHRDYIEIMEQLLISLSNERNSYLYNVVLERLSNSDMSYIYTKQWSNAAAFSMVSSINFMMREPNDGDVEYVESHLRRHYNQQFTRGMELYQKGEKAKGVKMLQAAHEVMLGNGSLGDHFYPAIRTIDLKEEYEAWVEISYQHLKKSLEAFPESGNVHNTMAWILSRAVRKLDKALEYSEQSHEAAPFEAAYIDTMAEIWHAKGDRKKAIDWGEQAVAASMYGQLSDAGTPFARRRTLNLDSQLDRFRSEPHPKP